MWCRLLLIFTWRNSCVQLVLVLSSADGSVEAFSSGSGESVATYVFMLMTVALAVVECVCACDQLNGANTTDCWQ